MKSSFQMLCMVGGLVAAVSSPLARADTGSDWFDAQVAQVQQRLTLRNLLADDLVRSQLALGYSVPEVLGPQGKTMQARADDNAFDRAMINLQRSLMLHATADVAH